MARLPGLMPLRARSVTRWRLSGLRPPLVKSVTSISAILQIPLRAPRPMLQEHSDVVLFANYRISVAKSDVGFNKKVTRALGSAVRVMHAEERPAFLAKNRYGLPDTLPLYANGGSSAERSQTALKRPGIGCSPSPASIRRRSIQAYDYTIFKSGSNF